MASLNDITKKSKSLADTISKTVASKAPVKTGNLKKALRRANNINTMLDIKGIGSKDIQSKDITITIDYAPDGAEYGMFWNEPTLSKNVKKGKTKNVPGAINFVEQALKDPAFTRAFDELIETITENMVSQIQDALEKD